MSQAAQFPHSEPKPVVVQIPQGRTHRVDLTQLLRVLTDAVLNRVTEPTSDSARHAVCTSPNHPPPLDLGERYDSLEADGLDSVLISMIAGSSYVRSSNPQWESASGVRPKLARGPGAELRRVDSKSGTDPA